MTEWVAFLVLTALLISFVLVFTHLTQRRLTFGGTEGIRDPTPGRIGGRHARQAKPPTAGPTSDDGQGSIGPTHPGSSGSALSTRRLLATITLTQGSLAVVVGSGAWYFGVPLQALGVTASPSSTGLPAVCVGLVAGIGLWLASEAATRLIDAAGIGYDARFRKLLAPAGTRGWLALLGIALPLVAVSEEVLFRAAAIGAPATGLDAAPWALAIGSSVAFGLCHGIQGRAGVAVTGALGLALAGVFLVTESLLAVVVAHYVVNAAEFLVHEGPVPFGKQ